MTQSKQGKRRSKEKLEPRNEQSVFRVGDIVYVWYPPAANNYVEGKIVDIVSKLIYKVQLLNGHVISAYVQCLVKKERFDFQTITG